MLMSFHMASQIHSLLLVDHMGGLGMDLHISAKRVYALIVSLVGDCKGNNTNRLI